MFEALARRRFPDFFCRRTCARALLCLLGSSIASAPKSANSRGFGIVESRPKSSQETKKKSLTRALCHRASASDELSQFSTRWRRISRPGIIPCKNQKEVFENWKMQSRHPLRIKITRPMISPALCLSPRPHCPPRPALCVLEPLGRRSWPYPAEFEQNSAGTCRIPCAAPSSRSHPHSHAEAS